MSDGDSLLTVSRSRPVMVRDIGREAVNDLDALNLALFVARVWIGGMFFAHGYRH